MSVDGDAAIVTGSGRGRGLFDLQESAPRCVPPTATAGLFPSHCLGEIDEADVRARLGNG